MNLLYGNFISPNFLFASSWGVLLMFLILWSYVWKGLALWNAAKNEEKYWFVVLLILNTVGILEIAYLFVFAKKKLKVESLLKNIRS